MTTVTFDPLRPPAPRRRRWPWIVLGLSLLGLVMLLALASAAWHEMQGAHGLAGVGEWRVGIDEDGWHGDVGLGGVLGVVVAVLVALFAVLVVVPLALLGAGLAVGLALTLAALAIAAALLLTLGAVLLVLVVATSPLWLIGLLLWWLLKPAAPAVASVSS